MANLQYAAIGLLFDTYELLMFPLVVRPGILVLDNVPPETPEFRTWIRLLFYVPAVCGGLFGLLGGYLCDRFGRLRIMFWSILIYSCSAFETAFSTSAIVLLALRCTTCIGISVEFVTGLSDGKAHGASSYQPQLPT